MIVDGERVLLHGASTDVADAETAARNGDFTTAFSMLMHGVAPAAPDSEWVTDLKSLIDRLVVETASRLVATPEPAEMAVAAFETLIAAEPWDKRHFDGLIAHHRKAGHEAAARDVERRWFVDDT